MYQPELGRFLQPDPKEFAAGDYNLYRYCHNDPVNRSDPFGFDDSAYKWALLAGPIQLEKVGNWGDRNSKDYYQASPVTANNAPAAGVTKAELHDLTPHENGSVTGKLLVDTHVQSDQKGKLADDLEQDHPNGWKEFHKGLSDQVLRQMVKDPQSFKSLKEFGDSRAGHVQKLFDAEKAKQRVWDGPDGKHNLLKRKDG